MCVQTAFRIWSSIARAPRNAIRVGERFDVSLRLAGLAQPPDGVRVAWRFAEQSGEAELGTEPTTIALSGGAVDVITTVPLELEARDPAGLLLSRNTLEFCVVPALRGAAPSLFPMDEAAFSALSAIDWPCDAAPDTADVVVATRRTTPVREALLAGRKVLLMANSADALIDPQRNLPANDRHNFPSMLLQSREGTPRDGQWMGAFGWRRMDGPLGRHCPTANLGANCWRAGHNKSRPFVFQNPRHASQHEAPAPDSGKEGPGGLVLMDAIPPT